MAHTTANAETDAISGDPAWMDGYRAALADALDIVESLGGPNFANFSAPVLLRLKTRLIEMQGHTRAA
ncbi:MAG: hypothetical protein KC482_11750 [Dehalococcoidia bacterium]|nr:hypothetical protein [Dehalococcoidia bacterium]MCA9846206.1 hypothetical protein [Dehalococcoidia bacterium]MCA9854246.1 hypothetical protein [Dehalococcoidia bacterium]